MIRMLKNCGGARDGRRRKREEGSGIQCTSQIAPPVGYQWARARRSPGVMAEAQAFCSHLLLEGSHQVCAELGVPCPRDAPAEPAVAARVVGRAPQPSERAVRGLLAGREEGRLYLLELGAVSRLRCGQPRAGARHERPEEQQDGGAHIPQTPAQRACTTQLERERLARGGENGSPLAEPASCDSCAAVPNGEGDGLYSLQNRRTGLVTVIKIWVEVLGDGATTSCSAASARSLPSVSLGGHRSICIRIKLGVWAPRGEGAREAHVQSKSAAAGGWVSCWRVDQKDWKKPHVPWSPPQRSRRRSLARAWRAEQQSPCISSRSRIFLPPQRCLHRPRT